jgi:C4-dicarboxylate-binding protein DctP
VIILLIISIVLALAGCGGNSSNGTASSETKIIMRIGHTQPINHPRHQSLLKFKELVEAKSNRSVEVQIFPAGQLGSDAEQMAMAKEGTLQAVRGNQLETAAPELLIYTMPFLFDSLEDVHKITRGPIGEKIARFAEKNNFAILATGDVGGLRDLTNSVRPITSPEDLRGLTMRTPPIESNMKTLQAFGASTIPVDYEEIHQALKSGRVEGQENPLINITALKLEEVQKYLTIINYQYMPDPFFVNLIWYNSLERPVREVIKDASVAMMLYNDELVQNETKRSLVKLQKGMVINTLSQDQRAKFIEKTKPVYDYYIGRGLFTAQDLAEIRKDVSKYR